MAETRETGFVHPTAVVHPQAELGQEVRIGAYAIIGENVRVGDGSEVMHHAVLDRNVTLGQKCKVFPFASIGTDPQDLSYKEDDTHVIIGDHNIIREFTTINRGTQKGGGVTRIGDHNYLMAYVHIAHDCRIHNHIILINGTSLAGHVEIEDYAALSAFCAVHQFVRIGRNAYIGGYSQVLQDVLPYAKITQKRNVYNLYGPNSIGMMRNGFSRDVIEEVKDMFKIIFISDLNTTQALEKLSSTFAQSEEAQEIVDFIRKSKRGILKTFTIDE